MNIAHIAVLICYVIVMVAVGAWFGRAKETSSGEDFVLAGRSLPAPVLGGTMLATFVGSGSIIGAANFAYTYGLTAGLLFFSGTVTGSLILVFLARRVRERAGHTVPELFDRRYGKAVRVAGTVTILIAFIGITAYQFTGAGYIISLITPLGEQSGAVLAAVLITFLALSGGLKSVAWTDFLSSVMIVFALWVTVFFVVGVDMGSDAGEISRARTDLGPLGGLSALQMLGFALPAFVLLLGDQNMYQRLAAAKSPKAAFQGAVVFILGAVVMIIPIAVLGVASSVLQPGIEPDMAVLSLSDGAFTPGVIGGALLAGAFALIVTTGSSYLLTCSANVVHDLVGQVRRSQPPTDRQNLWIGRIAVLVVATLGFVMVSFFPSVLALQMYAYTMYGATITPVLFAGLFWKRATAAGALSAMAVGALATIVWEVTGRSDELNSVLVALPLAVLSLVGVSLLTTRGRVDEPESMAAPSR
ncbi:sodium:solute symporter family protein [Brachybacterium sacelli]|uniref:SSS family solute:Na+ symporter n=1 Tax=Brachybacterium sacelli TaxID=173364 RepID=A0ABS4X4G0_9MICO|nr:sodium:solute symporter family protein [Brachybacterium sacelli]MBP2383353.1 SSS family solute:Na+ symporter [Brachybacterium sacelli]